MFEKTAVLIASMRALTNEIENVKALPEEMQDQEHHLYQADLEDALNDLITLYIEKCEADTSLTAWRALLASFSEQAWPERVGTSKA